MAVVAFCIRRHALRRQNDRVDRYPLTNVIQSNSPSPFMQSIYDPSSMLYVSNAFEAVELG